MGKLYIGSTTIGTLGKLKVGSSNILKIYAGTTLLFPSASAVISPTGSVDPTFTPGSFNSGVNAIATTSDQKVVVGGAFNLYSGSTQNYIVRLDTTGSKDVSFNVGTGFNSVVDAIVVDSSGKSIVGGQYTTFSGSTQNRLVRLNTDGTKDTGFNIGTGFNNSVLTVAINSSGKILVGGQFTTYAGGTQNYLVRLNSDGTKDTAFDIGTGFGAGGIFSVAVQSDGKVLVGGAFTTYRGLTQNRLIRLNTDGTKDTSFNVGLGIELGNVQAIAIQSDGKIIVGGSFRSYNGLTQNRLIRLNTDGTKDTSFNVGTGFDSNVESLAIDSTGKIIAGGFFTIYNGISQNRLIRLNTDGTKDTSFNVGTGFNNFVFTLFIDATGRILVGGDFTAYKGVAQNKLVRLT